MTFSTSVKYKGVLIEDVCMILKTAVVSHCWRIRVLIEYSIEAISRIKKSPLAARTSTRAEIVIHSRTVDLTFYVSSRMAL